MHPDLYVRLTLYQFQFTRSPLWDLQYYNQRSHGVVRMQAKVETQTIVSTHYIGHWSYRPHFTKTFVKRGIFVRFLYSFNEMMVIQGFIILISIIVCVIHIILLSVTGSFEDYSCLLIGHDFATAVVLKDCASCVIQVTTPASLQDSI